MEKSVMYLSAHQVYTRVKNGKTLTDNPIQRPVDQWDEKKNAELIRSTLDFGVVPPLFFIEKAIAGEKPIHDTIDGKQRINAILRYMDDEYSLPIDFKVVDCGDVIGKVDISGKKFSELPPEIRDTIKSFTFQACVMKPQNGDDIDELAREIFTRLNGGVPVSKSHLALVSASVPKAVREFIVRVLPLFEFAKFSDNQEKSSEKQLALLQAIVLIGEFDYSSFSPKHIEDSFERTDPEKIALALSLVEKVIQEVEISPENYNFFTKVNIPILLWLINEKGLVKSEVVDFVSYFLLTDAKFSDYRDYCGSSSIKPFKVQGRCKVLAKLYDGWKIATAPVVSDQPTEPTK